MTRRKELQNPVGVQLELFQSTKRLNLSETYEAIPKEVSLRDPALKWDNKYIANPIEKSFSIEGVTFFLQLHLLLFKTRKAVN